MRIEVISRYIENDCLITSLQKMDVLLPKDDGIHNKKDNNINYRVDYGCNVIGGINKSKNHDGSSNS